MKTSNTLRAFALSSAALAALVGNSGALAQSQNGKAALPSGMATQASAGLKKGHEALNNRRPAQDGELPRHAKAQSGVVGDLDANAISAPVVSLSLADGSIIDARLQRVASDAKRGSQSWIGTFDDSPGSVLVLTKAKGVVTGYANYKDQTLEILPAAGGKHLLYAVDSGRLPQSDGVQAKVTGGADTVTTTSDYGLGGSTLAAGDAVVQDLLVVYTAASAATWGQATLESMIQSAVQSANQAYLNSQANITLSIVGLQQVALSESSGMQATLSALQQNTEVRSLRDRLSADMVVLVSQNSDWCGYASLQVTNTSSGSNTDAYAVTWSSCLSSQTLAHEVGHLQGLDHNRENTSGGGAYPYSYGYRVCASNGFRDVMSYNCSTSVPRILQFSNPYVSYNGYPTGVSYEASPSSSAETARTLNNTAAKVAAYRVSGTSTPLAPTAPPAPSGLVVQNATSSSVTTGWADNATNEVGFKLERSSNGVDFSEIATLGADTRGFTDATVSARTAYYYRVRAYNSVGASAYTSTVSVTTPDVPAPPPAAPTSVSAGNNADGTARVSWSVGSTTATSFEVRREKWDTRKSVWSGATTAAIVPAGTLTIVDSTGAGSYRYSVRASNSGGASAYAGPAAVTVTSGTTTSGKKTPPGKR